MSDPVIATEVQLLKAVDVARILNISKAMTYRLIQLGEIPAVRINHAVRVLHSDLQEYIANHRKDSISE
jgi:excisionase family DNA binding protein